MAHYTRNIYRTFNDEDDLYRWLNLKDLINDTIYVHKAFVITGSLGLWDGRHTIVPVKEYGLFKALQRCCGDSIEYIEVMQEDGHFIVNASHHDGTNKFVIYLLNDKGATSENGDLTNRRYHKAMPKDWMVC